MKKDLGKEAKTETTPVRDSCEVGLSGYFGGKVNRISQWMGHGVGERMEPNAKIFVTKKA